MKDTVERDKPTQTCQRCWLQKATSGACGCTGLD